MLCLVFILFFCLVSIFLFPIHHAITLYPRVHIVTFWSHSHVILFIHRCIFFHTTKRGVQKPPPLRGPPQLPPLRLTILHNRVPQVSCGLVPRPFRQGALLLLSQVVWHSHWSQETSRYVSQWTYLKCNGHVWNAREKRLQTSPDEHVWNAQEKCSQTSPNEHVWTRANCQFEISMIMPRIVRKQICGLKMKISTNLKKHWNTSHNEHLWIVISRYR